MRRLAALALAIGLAACAQDTARLPSAPVPYGPHVAVETKPVPLNASDPRQTTVGDFIYAGGVMLTSAQTSRLHGLSDIRAWPDGRFLAQGDQGDQLEAHMVFDAAGRLVGVRDAVLRQLKDEQGRELYPQGERERDAEGIVEFANGDRLVSFEQDDRILLYPAGDGPPRRGPAPDIRFEFNAGMEGLAPYPLAGPDAYLVGIEATGETFLCRLSSGCEPRYKVQLSEDFRLAGMDVLPDGSVVYLLRGFELLHLSRHIIRIVAPDGRVVDEARLAPPITEDNYEGIAAVPQPGGRIRIYLISDDNFAKIQRTLLLAFDWTPPPAR